MIKTNMESNIINSLKRIILNGDRSELEKFWKELKENHTPIIEKIPNDDNNVLITLIYKGNEDVKNVVLFSNQCDLDIDDMRFEKIQDSNIWYKTLEVRNDIKISYYLSVNDPLNDDWEERDKCIEYDPFGKIKIIMPKDEDSEDEEDDDWSQNIVELPKSNPEIWSIPRDEIPKGRLEKFVFKSEILNHEFRVWIHTPAGYSQNETYKFLVLNDGFWYAYGFKTPTLIDNLIYDKKISPVVTAFIDIDMDVRDSFFTCNDDFNSFIVKEIVPWVREKYNVSHRAEDCVIGGVSFGAFAATYLGLKNSETFGNVISQSGSYWCFKGWTEDDPEEAGEVVWMSEEFKACEKLDLNFYLEIGDMEDSDMLPTNRDFRDALLSKGYNVEYYEFPGGHDFLSWGENLARGLMCLIKGN